MGDNPASKRDYKHERELMLKRAGEREDHAARLRARRSMVKEYGKEALAGKDIDHIRPLRDISAKEANNRNNYRVSSVRANRNWRKGQKGYD